MAVQPIKTVKALEIINISSRNMIRWPILIGLVAICIVTLSVYLTLFFLIQHFYFGVNVIDFSTIINFLGCPITTHLLQTIFCIVCLICATLILSIFSFTATFILLNQTVKKSSTFSEFFLGLKSAFIELIRYSAIVTFGYMKRVFNILSITDNLAILQDTCDGSYTPQEDKYSNALNALLFPLLVKKPGIVLKNLRETSSDLIQKKFGKDVQSQYSFTYITYALLLCIFAGSYILYNFDFVRMEIAFLLGLVTFVVYWSFTYLINIAFSVDLYNYCYNENFLIYSSDFLASTFKNSGEL